jgi:hypothetical protein
VPRVTANGTCTARESALCSCDIRPLAKLKRLHSTSSKYASGTGEGTRNREVAGGRAQNIVFLKMVWNE